MSVAGASSSSGRCAYFVNCGQHKQASLRLESLLGFAVSVAPVTTGLHILRVVPVGARPGPRLVFFFNVAAPTEIYTLSLHDALPISSVTCAIAARNASTSRTSQR